MDKIIQAITNFIESLGPNGKPVLIAGGVLIVLLIIVSKKAIASKNALRIVATLDGSLIEEIKNINSNIKEKEKELSVHYKEYQRQNKEISNRMNSEKSKINREHTLKVSSLAKQFPQRGNLYQAEMMKLVSAHQNDISAVVEEARREHEKLNREYDSVNKEYKKVSSLLKVIKPAYKVAKSAFKKPFKV